MLREVAVGGSGLIREVAFGGRCGLWWEWPDKRADGGGGLIREVAVGGNGLIREVAFGGSGLI